MRILVVDDSFLALKKLTALLEAYGDCDAATNGPQALQMFGEAASRGAGYDLITLDIEMPGANGLHVLKAIRQRELLRQTPRARILMISGSSSQSNVRSAAKLHCDAFMVKPVSREALTVTLGRLGIAAPGTDAEAEAAPQAEADSQAQTEPEPEPAPAS